MHISLDSQRADKEGNHLGHYLQVSQLLRGLEYRAGGKHGQVYLCKVRT